MAAEPEQDPQQIDDPEELSQKKRVREILNRRKDVIEARNLAIDEMNLGSATRAEGLAHYQSRIESLIIDLWTKFDAEDVDNGKQYLNSEVIDTVQIPPPEELVLQTTDLAAGAETPDPKTVTIQGLKWFIENDPVVSASFTAYTWNPPGEKTMQNSRYLPISTLDKALVICFKFIDESGIDANLETEEQQTKIDRELLEEVDEWRKQNVE